MPNPLLRRDLALLTALAFVSLLAGALQDRLRGHPMPLVYRSPAERIARDVAALGGGQAGDQSPPRAASPGESQQRDPKTHQTRSIGLAEFRKLVEGKSGLILDARPELFHRVGHVPGALSFPRERFQSQYGNHRATLESKKGQPIAIYCSSEQCEDSELVANALRKLGHLDVLIYRGGWNEWKREGLPQERG